MRHVFAKLTHPTCDSDQMLCHMTQACENVGFQVLNYVDHYFNPQGYTAIILLGESHFSVHTFPEYGYMMMDCFSCSDKLNPESVIDMFRAYTGCELIEIDVVER